MIERFFFIVKRRVRFFILLTDMPFRKYIKKKKNPILGLEMPYYICSI